MLGPECRPPGVTDLRRFRDNLRTETAALGEATSTRAYATIRSALRDAYAEGLIRADPTATKGRRTAKPTRTALNMWSPVELGRFLDWAEKHDPAFGDLVEFAAMSGLRRGELCALRRVGVSPQRGRITVNQSAVQTPVYGPATGRSPQRIIVGKPKTASGEGRVVEVDPGTMAVPERVAARRADTNTGLVFTRRNGTP